MGYVRTPHESLFTYDQDVCFDLGVVVGKYRKDELS